MADVKHFDQDAALETVVRLFWRQGVASTGIQDIVTATGLNRSSLYATFGGKQQLYMAALERYVTDRSRPALGRLTEDERGLPAVTDFFAGLIETRCTGEYARWGCMISNAHTGAENTDLKVRALLDRQHQRLRDAFHAALRTAQARGQLAPGTDPAAGAEVLALVAYGVNLRSRAGASADDLARTVGAALDAVTGRSS
ncbi:TetR/AcrR family transcriptional regulator [Streptomyces sp. NPDC085481]|uniref:TetR/AcrR family transcriptional regulator n=1 Tax=Streptomyces sp. NPDC085481 TaxID=3365727 RepID=UPI0037D4872C